MKLTLSWLEDHLDTSASLAEVCETLARIGPVAEESAKPKRCPRAIGFAIYNSRYAKPAPEREATP